MRKKIIRKGANELSYEIRGIVKKAKEIEALGYEILWENIGDPIKKNTPFPTWIKDILIDLIQDNDSFSYSHSKGLLETREFIAKKNNELDGVKISAEDIIFFNGLGDAIQKIYQYLEPTSRVIGPSPAYSTHSSAEAAHSNNSPITYNLDPENSWFPDLDDLYFKVKYNENIVGILVINPDNPTGMVYPKNILEKIVEIADEFNLFLVFDEIYANIVYNDAQSCLLSEVIGKVPGISLKGISKEFPWPGARCGWAEFYNLYEDNTFYKLFQVIENAKMLEVSATMLPQKAIPLIMSNPQYKRHIQETNKKIEERSQYLDEVFSKNPYIKFNKTNGAFYNTLIFKENALKNNQKLTSKDSKINQILDNWMKEEMAADKRFVYYLLACKRVCVVPISSFASHLLGIRITLLENDPKLLKETYNRIKSGIVEYCESA